MIIKGKLSLTQKEKGKKGLLLFSFLNGIALTFVTGNVMSLYLLQLGCSTSGVAVCASIAYIGSLFVFFGKKSIIRFGASITLGINWIICGISVILIALIPFFFQSGHSNSKMAVILLITFLFFVFKQIGTASTQPLMGEFTSKEDQGRFSSSYFLLYNLATIIAIVSLVYLITTHSPLFIFQMAIIFGGIIFIFCSSVFIGMKETQTPSKSAKATKTKSLLAAIWNNPEYRNFLIVKSSARAGMIIIIPISIIALKSLYGVNDQTALVFACIQLVGGVFINYINRIISGFTGPKPLIIIYIIGMFSICALWVLAPNIFIWEYFLFIFLLGGICLFGLDSTLNHYYLTIIPREDSVGISLWYTTIGGAVAGISGLLFGGGLIQFLTVTVVHTEIFKFYYATMFILMIPVLYFAFKLKTASDWSVKDVINLLLTPSEMRTASKLQYLNKYSSAKEELDNVLKLHGMSSNLSEKSLIYYLNSPMYFVRLSALRAINNLTIGEEAKKAVYKELQHGDNSTAYLAAIIFARNPYPKAIPLLRKYLTSTDYHLVGNSMIALVSMEDKDSYKQIINIYSNSTHPRIIINGTMAIAMIDDIKLLKCLLQKLPCFINNPEKKYIADEIVWSIARLFKVQISYYKSIRIFQDDFDAGVLNVMELIDKNKISNIKESPEEILELCFNAHLGCKRFSLRNFLIKSLQQYSDKKEYKMISDFLLHMDHNMVCREFALFIFIILFCKKI